MEKEVFVKTIFFWGGGEGRVGLKGVGSDRGLVGGSGWM